MNNPGKEKPYPVDREAEEITEKLHVLEQSEREMKERLLYLRAEVDNFRKAANREIEELRRNGNVALLRSLVPVSRMLDSINHLAQNEKNERMAEGLDIISKQLSRVFEIFGMSITENLESSFGSEELSAE